MGNGGYVHGRKCRDRRRGRRVEVEKRFLIYQSYFHCSYSLMLFIIFFMHDVTFFPFHYYAIGGETSGSLVLEERQLWSPGFDSRTDCLFCLFTSSLSVLGRSRLS